MTKTKIDIIANEFGLKGEISAMPIKAGTVKNFFISNMEKRMKDICELNNISFDKENTIIGQFWIVIPDSRCDNYGDNEIVIKKNGERLCFRFTNHLFLPLSLFEGKAEGEMIHIKIPFTIYDVCYNKAIDNQYAILTLRLNQRDYRYGDFERFEEVINKIKG